MMHTLFKHYFLLGFVLLGSFFLVMLPDNFRLFLLGVGLVWLVAMYLTRNLFQSLFLLLIITLQFSWPAKYYEFVLLGPREVRAEQFQPEGVMDGYGFLASDLVAIALILCLVREVVITHSLRLNNLNLKNFLSDLWQQKAVLGLWLAYLGVSFVSSLQLSFYPTFSLVHLFQIAKILVLFVAARYFVLTQKKFDLRQVIAGLLLFQVIVSIFQLFGGLATISANQQYMTSYVDLEAESFWQRATGIFSHPNQLAFITSLLTLVGLSLSRGKRNLVVMLTVVSAVILVLVAQSRTVWLTLGILFLYSSRGSVIPWDKLKPYVASVRVKVFLFLAVAIACFLALLRLSKLPYSSEQGSLGIRWAMLEEGWSVLQQTPMVGWGVNTNVKVMWEHFPEGYVIDFPYAIHTAYLQMALESGIGVLFFMLPIYLCFRNGLIKSKDNKAWYVLHLCSVMILVYYFFQPHGGKSELPWLGLVLGLLIPQNDKHAQRV